MELTTKFDIGDKVTAIWYNQKEVFDTCSFCEGSGRITVKEKSFECPDCYGDGSHTRWETQQWNIANEDDLLAGYNKVIKIDINVTKKETQVRYILGSRYTDSCSGTLWPEDCLFKTREAALGECYRRNEELNKPVAINL